MADTHVVLIKCRKNTELIDVLAKGIAEQCTGNGGRLLSCVFTVGPYDVVATVQLASQFMPVFTLQTKTFYDVSEVVVMRAFSQEETHEALHSWVPGDNFGHMGPRESGPE